MTEERRSDSSPHDFGESSDSSPHEIEERSDSSRPARSAVDVPLDDIPLHSTNLLTVLDRDGVIRYESPSIEQLYGFDQDELVGTQVTDYFHSEDRERVVTAFQTVVSSSDHIVESVEYRHENVDGEYVWVESVASSNPTPDGLYVVNSRDITERKEREQALEARTTQLEARKRELRRFRRAVEAAGHAVFITDEEGTIEYGNPAFETITGYTASEAIGRTPRILSSREMSTEYFEQLWETILAGNVWSETIVNQRKSGDHYHASQTISPIVDGGETVAFVAIQSDTTERKEREKQLERQNERLDHFADVISHDIRNPLTTAQLHLDLARENGDATHFDAIGTAHDRIESMVEELLLVTRAGKTGEETERVKLADSTRLAWATSDTTGGELRLDVPETCVLSADPESLRHVLENLFRNATDHNGSSVTVTVGLLEGEQPTGFYVEDDGLGISRENRTSVFDYGFSTADDGTGLGLAIVENYVQAQGWDITVLEGTEGGARFEISGVDNISS